MYAKFRTEIACEKDCIILQICTMLFLIQHYIEQTGRVIPELLL